MAIDRGRRRFVVASAALVTGAACHAGAAVVPTRNVSVRNDPQLEGWPDLLASWEEDGVNYAGLWTESRGAQGLPLPSRAHGVLVDPLHADQAIVVARRPGDYLMRFDMRAARAITVQSPEPTRVFNGHAVFSVDGRTLYTSENDTRDGSGLIGVRDAATLLKRSEFATHGADPHAVLLEPSGILLIANGGIRTLPETGRVKLNIDRMDSSLVRLDARDGRLLGQWRLPDARLGMRHLARSDDGRIGIALQSEHPAREERENAPVFAGFDGVALRVGERPRDVKLGGYGGDVTRISEGGGDYFVVSCTRAGLVAWWDREGHYQGTVPMKKACALAPCGNTLLAASEEGELERVSIHPAQSFAAAAVGPKWDNHMVVLRAARRT